MADVFDGLIRVREIRVNECLDGSCQPKKEISSGELSLAVFPGCTDQSQSENDGEGTLLFGFTRLIL